MNSVSDGRSNCRWGVESDAMTTAMDVSRHSAHMLELMPKCVISVPIRSIVIWASTKRNSSKKFGFKAGNVLPENSENENSSINLKMQFSAVIYENWKSVLCFFVHLFLLWAVFDTYYNSPLVHGMTPHGEMPDDVAPASRLVLFVADGLRAHSLYENVSRTPFLK